MNLTYLLDALKKQPVDRDGVLIEPLYSALYYATLLLRELQSARDDYRVLRFNIEEKRFIGGLSRQVQPHVADFFSGGMMPYRSVDEHREGLDSLFRKLRELERFEHNRPLLLARAVAVAIDRTALADMTMEQFSNYYSVFRPEQLEVDDFPDEAETVQPGDPIPTCFGVFGRHEASAQSRESSFGTNPQNLPAFRNPDRLPRVVLAPNSVAAFDLRLNFDYDRELLNVQQGSTKIATFHPTKKLADDFSYRTMGQDKERFFNVRTRCSDDLEPDEEPGLPTPAFASRAELQEHISNGIREAARLGANLFLMPELVLASLDAEQVFMTWRDVVEESYAEKEESDNGGREEISEHRMPQLMIPGSWHTMDDGGARFNVAEVWGAGREFDRSGSNPRGAFVYKTVPYAHRIGNVTTVENINTPSRPPLVLFCSQNATMMVFICIDFLLDELRDLARDAYVSLVVIPSMSGKSRVFTELMIGHVAATEAVVIFLDALEPVDDPNRSVVMVRHPDHQTCFAINDDTVPALADARGVVVTDLGTDGDRHDFVAL